MEESNRKKILKYLNTSKKYNIYFNNIFYIFYTLYKTVNYDKIFLIGGAMFYMLYNKYKNVINYNIEHFKTFDFDILCIIDDNEYFYYDDPDIVLKEIQNRKLLYISMLNKILRKKSIKKRINKINSLLGGGNYYVFLKFIIFHKFKSYKIIVFLKNDHVCIHFLDIIIITCRMEFEHNKCTYKNKTFLGENYISSISTLLYPNELFWVNIKKLFSNKYYNNKQEIFLDVQKILNDNIVLYNKFIYNYIRSRFLFDIIIYLSKNDLFDNTFSISKQSLLKKFFVFKSNFITFLLNDHQKQKFRKLYKFLKYKNTEIIISKNLVILYLNFVFEISSYLYKEILEL